MLASVQQFANRVEENRRLAEERNFQKERDTTNFERQIEGIKLQDTLREAGAVAQFGRATAEARDFAEFQDGLSIRQEERAFERQTSEESYEHLRRLTEIQSGPALTQSMIQGQREAIRAAQSVADNFNRTVTSNISKYPSLVGWGATVGPNGEPIIYQEIEGELRQRSETDYQRALGNAVELEGIAEQLLAVLEQNDFSAERQSQVRAAATAMVSGRQFTPETARAELNTLLGDAQTRAVTPEESRERNRALNSASSLVYNDLFGPTITSDARQVVRQLPRNKTLPTSEEIRSDSRVFDILTGPGRPDQKRIMLENLFTQNYASVNDLRVATNDADKRWFDKRTPFHDTLQTRLDYMIGNASTGITGSSIFINPFSSNVDEDTRSVVDARALGNDILTRYNAGTLQLIQPPEQLRGTRVTRTPQ
jgi:hypothetical protein